MIWPFKRKRAIPFAEAVADRPDVPCGSKADHYLWTDIEGMPCPACMAAKTRQREREQEDRMAEKIAAAVVRQMAVASPRETGR